jgi:ornithine carbamoyltransferase
VDCIAARTYEQAAVEEIAAYADVPVINALSDAEHPCQVMADLLTIRERKGRLAGLVVAYIGDGNNVANSLALAAGLNGMHLRVASPEGYGLPKPILDRANRLAAESRGSIEQLLNPWEAVAGADVVYTDVWASMGQEKDAAIRREDFAGYTVDTELMAKAESGAIFMHDLPAHRGEEVTAEVMDGPQSVVFDQAENRLHAQKALLVSLIGEEE